MPKYIGVDRLRRDIDNYFPFDKATQKRHNAFDIAKGELLIIIANQPAADVVEVVRCKNCIFSKRYNDVYPDLKMLNEDRWCELYGRKPPDWFCGDGERREDG